MKRHLALATLLVLGATQALAAGRVPYGGELRLAHDGSALPSEPSLADTPLEATLLGLLTEPPCRWDGAGQPLPALARDMSRPWPQVPRLSLPSPAHAAALARAWERLARGETPSPYRALLFPLRGQGRQLSPSGASLELPLAFPWPDFERTLCHPALAPPASSSALAPFSPASPSTLEATLAWPRGRPYLDKLLLTSTDERGLRRLWAARGAHVALGLSPEADMPAPPALYATYLSFSPRRLPPDFRQAVESAIDREDLTRLFIRGPAVPMPHLLPPALIQKAPRARPAPPAPQPRRRVTLLYDMANEDQRAVAERLQVKLHERGYAVALEAMPRAMLRTRQARGDFELMLQALLLPPVPSAALAVVLEAAGRHDLLGVELPVLGALSDAEARDAKARERALALAPSLPMLPLFAQGLALRVAPEVEGLVFDAQGLPMLEGAWLRPTSPMATGGHP